MILRDYQADIVSRVELAWMAGLRVVLARLATGGGKTPILAKVIADHTGFICAIAHRDKLVEQMSMTLARAGVRHDLIASEKTKRIIAKKHVKRFGQCFYVAGARCRVASVDTLVRAEGIGAWMQQVTLWIVDEGHHLLKENKWGKCIARFTHAECRGLLLTATPGRPDGKGLGAHHDGFAEIMVEGPPERWLIEQGYLCDYVAVCPPSDMIVEGAPKGSGDYSNAQLRTAARTSHIVGDVPKHYLKFAAGKSGITFAPDVETAVEIVGAYRAVGVSAELITGETDTTIRDEVFDRSERGELRQIVAVDVISEGVDIPALQVGSFARPTASIITWRQQIGRLLRPIYAPGYDLSTQAGRLAAIAASSKPHALLIFHNQGLIDPKLGPPDKRVVWTLDRRQKRGEQDEDPDEIPQRICANPVVDCFRPYPRIFRKCPHCGYQPEPAGRSAPAMVDGDLEMLTPEALAALRGDVIDPTKPRHAFEAAQIAKGARSSWLNSHWAAYTADGRAQIALRAAMDRFGGHWNARGDDDTAIQRRFFLLFGIDVVSALALKEKDAIDLTKRIDEAVNKSMVRG